MKISMTPFRECKDYSDLIEGYREKVIPVKTRTIRLLGRKNPARIIHTLLGYEVQASYKRIQCPDLVTARYLRLFSELGCHSIKLPYDPTLTEQLIPGFEAAVDNLQSRVQQLFPGEVPTRQYVLRRVYEMIRQQIAAA
jgi:hypothetical protein